MTSVFIEKIISFATGSKVIPRTTETSSCFAISGDFYNPINASFEEFDADYMRYVKSAELALPADQSGIYRRAEKISMVLN